MFNKKVILFLLFFVSLNGGLFAQNSDDWYYDKEIVDIEFIGLNAVNPDDVYSIVSSFLGQKFTDEVYAEILNRIYSLEYFNDIIPTALPANIEGSKVIFQFEVVEQPVISKIGFSGNKELRSGELRDKITIKENDIYTESKVVVEERRIRDLYFEKGFTNIEVTSNTSEDENGITVTFFINEGQSTVLSSIKFQGNTIASEQSLKKLFQLKEVGLFQKGAFQESLLEQDKQSVIYYYQTKGYIDAVIENVVQDISYNEKKDRNEMILTYVIKEGEQFFFNGITTKGNLVFSDEELLSLMKLKKGDVFNQLKFQEGMAAIADKYYENGYTYNSFQPEVNREQGNLVTSVLHITEQPRSHIESITVVGNTKTKNHVILREIPLQSGDIFSKAKLETGLRSLYNLQFFNAIAPEIPQGSEEGLVDIVLNVEERSTVSLEFGITFSGVTDPSAWPVSLFANWSDTNFLGSGKEIAANVTGSNEEQSLSFSFTDPWFLNQSLNFNASVYVKHLVTSTLYNHYGPGGVNTEDYYMDYNQFSFGFDIGLGKRWVWEEGSLTTQAGIGSEILRNFYDADLYGPVDTVVSDRHGKFGVENSLYTKLAFDGRDLYYDPSKGFFASETLSWTGLIPKIESEYYLRSDTKLEGYFTLLDVPVTELWNLKFVIAAYTNLGVITPARNSTISSDSLYEIDGMFNGRGWGQGLEDQSYDVEGQIMWSSFVEFRWPIAPGIFAADFFFDAVAIKETPKEFFTNLSGTDFFFSFGPGLRFSLPQFPLRLLWAWSFKIDDTGHFEWNNKNKNRGAFVLSFNLTNQ